MEQKLLPVERALQAYERVARLIRRPLPEKDVISMMSNSGLYALGDRNNGVVLADFLYLVGNGFFVETPNIQYSPKR